MKQVLRKIKPKTLKYIGFAFYVLSFIYFIRCTIYEYPYFPITVPLLAATFCCLIAENNTEHITDSIMLIVFFLAFTFFSYLDLKTKTDNLLEGYATTKGRVVNIKFHTATPNSHSTVFCRFLLSDDKIHTICKDYSTIPPFKYNDSVFVVYQSDNFDNVWFFKSKKEVDKWIKKSSFSKFWEEAYWLRRIVIIFILFGIIPYVLLKVKRH
ncbi:hypothetical protein M2451_003307 [Dysgonomonas sp. PFB1-18]|uniref:hypothetical protein n=1 Tax=unclassified Dysgonomonas TaxID=2630389 RepID=UPI002473A5BF|nr:MULTISPECIES: hypothetical protein [unclassified Dysgonomonas]MDH6310421.1 hypothetical protein [Dysgonomonas sp. PF1-14]MDH6340249.1 hypothetical protein [Dysgonomonas sp. PF1-16]MDH6381970.1 hypothetical protein [Dysgonomonas sp. PFB1-18]MDH6399221.1 hypothetical protein [Dysgonomonas sp. PF1-23]